LLAKNRAQNRDATKSGTVAVNTTAGTDTHAPRVSAMCSGDSAGTVPFPAMLNEKAHQQKMQGRLINQVAEERGRARDAIQMDVIAAAAAFL
jgi:hypothetical protein